MVPMLSVSENIFLDELPINKFHLVDKKLLRKKTKEIIDKFRIPIDPDTPVGRLPVAYQQMVEIMKAYRRDSDIIAFDEPTAPLTDEEITTLFRLIRELKDQGKVILYVSHRMAEIFQVTDKIIVLKDGQFVKELRTTETSEKELIRAMVGRDIGDTYAKLKRNDKMGDVVLEVKNLSTDMLHDVSFTLRCGEVLGFAGLVGAGRTEVMRAIFGIDPILSGEVSVKGEKVDFKSPKDAIDCGIALCPEDRKDEGLVLQQSIKSNLSMPVLPKLTKNLLIDRKKEIELANEAIDRYKIKTHTIDKKTVELSGGNQQKVILGRWTSSELTTDILMLDEPTKGIDVGTKAEIYQRVCDFAREGKASYSSHRS
jgi:ABC-type sugar transport system ATPase subunit